MATDTLVDMRDRQDAFEFLCFKDISRAIESNSFVTSEEDPPKCHKQMA